MALQPAADGQALEKRISDWVINVVIDQQSTLPLKGKTKYYFVLKLWTTEQAQGIAAVMKQEGYLMEAAKETNLKETEIKVRITRCNVFMLGTLSTAFSPVESAVEHISSAR